MVIHPTIKAFDLLFIKGDTVISSMIKKVTDSHYSHVAIVLDTLHVAETDWRYPVQIRHGTYELGIYDVYRYRETLSEEQRQRMQWFIEMKKNTKYDLVRTISNGLFLLFKIPIRDAIDRMNCTELAYLMFKEAGVDLEPLDLTPGGLSSSKRLIRL